MKELCRQKGDYVGDMWVFLSNRKKQQKTQVLIPHHWFHGMFFFSLFPCVTFLWSILLLFFFPRLGMNYANGPLLLAGQERLACLHVYGLSTQYSHIY